MPRWNHSVCCYKEILRDEECKSNDKYANYVLVATGGLSDKGAKTAEYYSFAADQWRELPDLLTKRYSHASCVMGSVVYVFGGVTID